MDMISDEKLLAADEEVELAKVIEAGVLAGAALAGRFDGGDASHDELVELVREGERAWERMFLANLRLVWSIARPVAARTATNPEELFQEGCIGLAEGIRRWDHRMGTRFSVVAWKWIRHHVQNAVIAQQESRRTRGDLRAAAEVLAVQERFRQAGQDRSVEQVARSLGRDPLHVLRVVEARHVPLGDVTDQLADESAAARFEEVETSAPDWIYRLQRDEREILLLRNGFAGEPRSYAWCARHFNTSASSIRRLEERALRSARTAASWSQARDAA